MRIAEIGAEYWANPNASLPSFTSSPDEIQRAVERNSIKRGLFFIKNLMALDFFALLQRVGRIAQAYDREEWCESAASLHISVEALSVLDNVEPPIPYPYYFCMPEILTEYPELTMYYRNVAMMSQKVMSDMGLTTIAYEAGRVPPLDIALDLVHHFNKVVSALVVAGRITPQRHLEMAYANLGDSFGGSWRNEVGRLAYVEVISPLILHLHQQGHLRSIVYSLKAQIARSGAEGRTVSRKAKELGSLVVRMVPPTSRGMV